MSKNKDKIKKEKTKLDDKSKSVIIRCVSVIICTAVVCGSALNSSSKIADSIKHKVSGSVSDESTSDNAEETLSEQVAETTQSSESTAENSETNSSSESSSTAGSSESSKTTVPDKTNSGAMTKAQMIDVYNKAANSAKSSSKSITQNYCRKKQTSTPEINSGLIKPIADKLINANMGDDESKANATYTSAADKNANFPVNGQSWSSKLTEADVKSITKTTSGKTDTYVIQLVDDTQPNITPGNGHAGKAMSTVTKQQIVDGAGGAGMAFIKEDSIKVTVKNCKITAQIDSSTGKLLKANYFHNWTLALSTTVGLNIAVSFSIEEDYKINW